MSGETLVYVVDDDIAVRTAIADLVEDMGCKASSYSSAQDFLDAISDNIYGHCLVLDIRMPGMSGMELLQKLHNDDILLPVILVTGHGDIPMTVEALKLGAVDVLEKPFREQVLWEKIHNAMLIGEQRCSFRSRKEAFEQKISLLKPKELRVIKFLLEGQNDKLIAHQVGVTRRAVAFQRTNALKKLQVGSVVELAKVISELGIDIAA